MWACSGATPSHSRVFFVSAQLGSTSFVSGAGHKQLSTPSRSMTGHLHQTDICCRGGMLSTQAAPNQVRCGHGCDAIVVPGPSAHPSRQPARAVVAWPAQPRPCHADRIAAATLFGSALIALRRLAGHPSRQPRRAVIRRVHANRLRAAASTPRAGVRRRLAPCVATPATAEAARRSDLAQEHQGAASGPPAYARMALNAPTAPPAAHPCAAPRPAGASTFRRPRPSFRLSPAPARPSGRARSRVAAPPKARQAGAAARSERRRRPTAFSPTPRPVLGTAPTGQCRAARCRPLKTSGRRGAGRSGGPRLPPCWVSAAKASAAHRSTRAAAMPAASTAAGSAASTPAAPADVQPARAQPG